MKKKIYNQLTYLRDKLPECLCPPIDWLRDLFWEF